MESIISNQHPWSKGDLVRFFSPSRNEWLRGEVIQIFENNNENDIRLIIQIQNTTKTEEITPSKHTAMWTNGGGIDDFNIYTKGNYVRFLSPLRNHWYRGKIIKIFNNDNKNDIQLKIQYTVGTRTKEEEITRSNYKGIQRRWRKGDGVRFFSICRNGWFRGRIIKIFKNENKNDIQLTIQYTVGTTKKTEEITPCKHTNIYPEKMTTSKKKKIVNDHFENNTKKSNIFLCQFDKYLLCIAGFIRRIKDIGIFQQFEVPLDIHNTIYCYYVLYRLRLMFCDENGDIDQCRYIERGIMQNLKLKHLYVTLQHELFKNGVDEIENEQILPEIHLWIKYGAIREIYPIDRKVTVTKEEILSQDQNRWIEIPDEYLKTNCNDLNDLTIVVERRNVDGTWPRAKGDDWINIKCGDILEVKDDQNKWYESMVRYVYPKQDYIIVHYINWNNKWDERLSIIGDIDRIAPRYTHTKRPHQGKLRKVDNPYVVYVVFESIREKIQLSSHYMYFESLLSCIRNRFKINGDVEITTCSGFKIKNENDFKAIVHYYMDDLFVNKQKNDIIISINKDFTMNKTKKTKKIWKMNREGTFYEAI